jgi:hypothetical protein
MTPPSKQLPAYAMAAPFRGHYGGAPLTIWADGVTDMKVAVREFGEEPGHPFHCALWVLFECFIFL